MAGLGQKAELHQPQIAVPFSSQSANRGPSVGKVVTSWENNVAVLLADFAERNQ
jgi:hypothetical protein